MSDKEEKKKGFFFISSSKKEEERRPHTVVLADIKADPKKRSYRILIADDEVSTRMILRKLLNDEGYTVVEAKDGIEAWDIIYRGNIDLIIMDMKMPGMHGLEILKKMRLKKLSLPVIIYSAYSDMMNSFTVMSYPNQRFLVKPTNLNIILENVKELLKKENKT